MQGLSLTQKQSKVLVYSPFFNATAKSKNLASILLGFLKLGNVAFLAFTSI